MSAHRVLPAVFILLLPALLAGCAADKSARNALSPGLQAFSDSGDAAVQPGEVGEKAADEAGLPRLPASAAPAADLSGAPAGGAGGSPLIIKQAQVRLEVADTDQAIDRFTQIVSDTRGYIISNRIWYQPAGGENFKYATYTIGVPVDMFETALRRIRSLGVRVLDETAGGQDVSEEYVDLESRLHNLEATRDRIRGFLDQAQTVEESLRINNELAAIEEQIEQVQGRMRYLAGRAAYSTITVQFDPSLPAAPTPTPTPEPVPYVWDPGATFQRASGMAVKAGQFLVDAFIYLAVWLPFAVPALIVWMAYKIATRKRKVIQS
ncbi:MAG: DUF4349 domain-containing protein [Anaerolineales bacterium]|nr:DUF4349 domain-containing protein [Anaerolineales bacterium]